MKGAGLLLSAALAAALAVSVDGCGAGSDRRAPAPHLAGRIVFGQYDGVSGIVLQVDADGGHRHILDVYRERPRWSPDGDLIAVGGCGAVADPRCTSAILDRRRHTATSLPAPEVFRDTRTTFGPTAWSPDGSTLVGSAESSRPDLDGLWTIDARDGSSPRRLTVNLNGRDVPGGYSPDGRSVLFVRSVPDSLGDLVVRGLFTVSVADRVVRPLTPAAMLVDPDHGGRFSPDGRTVVFGARAGDGARYSLWLIDVDGTGLRRLHTALPCGGSRTRPPSYACSEPAWSPDGRHLVFATRSASTPDRDLYVVDADGSHLRQLTHGDPADTDPDWGP